MGIWRRKGRTEAKKLWDHIGTLDGLQDALDVVGFVWDGADLVTKGVSKGEDLVSSLRFTYRAAADKAAGMQKYLDDVLEQMAAGRMGNGQYRFCFAGGYMDDSSRFMYEIHDDAGETISRISRMDDMLTQGC